MDSDTQVPVVRRLIERIDLRPYTRRADVCLTKIEIQSDISWVPWLTLGELSRLEQPVEGGYPISSRVAAYMSDGVVDPEHDSCYALVLCLAGVRLVSCSYHMTTILGVLVGEADDDLRVPAHDWDPFANVTKVKQGKETIQVVDWYTPPPTLGLLRLLRGRQVRIQMGTVHGESVSMQDRLRHLKVKSLKGLVGRSVVSRESIEIATLDSKGVLRGMEPVPVGQWKVVGVDQDKWTVNLLSESPSAHHNPKRYGKPCPVAMYPDELGLPT